MPLLDHFHPPLTPERAWESFHSMWATEVARTLNRRVLPKGYFAEAQVHIGGRVEVGVPTFQKEPGDGLPVAGLSGGVALETWAPPVRPGSCRPSSRMRSRCASSPLGPEPPWWALSSTSAPATRTVRKR